MVQYNTDASRGRRCVARLLCRYRWCCEVVDRAMCKHWQGIVSVYHRCFKGLPSIPRWHVQWVLFLFVVQLQKLCYKHINILLGSFSYFVVIFYRSAKYMFLFVVQVQKLYYEHTRILFLFFRYFCCEIFYCDATHVIFYLL